jgi:hypothetical protein
MHATHTVAGDERANAREACWVSEEGAWADAIAKQLPSSDGRGDDRHHPRVDDQAFTEIEICIAGDQAESIVPPERHRPEVICTPPAAWQSVVTPDPLEWSQRQALRYRLTVGQLGNDLGVSWRRRDARHVTFGDWNEPTAASAHSVGHEC